MKSRRKLKRKLTTRFYVPVSDEDANYLIRIRRPQTISFASLTKLLLHRGIRAYRKDKRLMDADELDG